MIRIYSIALVAFSSILKTMKLENTGNKYTRYQKNGHEVVWEGKHIVCDPVLKL